MRFLVVDDSATMRRIVVNSLQRVGFTEVVEAADGAEALEKLSGIDFLITDWNMPKVSGAELTRAVRARDDSRGLPIIMVTARSVRDDILTAMEAGVDSYVVKPFTPQVLREKIDAVLASRAAA
jgi:two-component system chemotaxis response regulator CheY